MLKVGDKVHVVEYGEEFTGYIININESSFFPYTVSINKEDVGMSNEDVDLLDESDDRWNLYNEKEATITILQKGEN